MNEYLPNGFDKRVIYESLKKYTGYSTLPWCIIYTHECLLPFYNFTEVKTIKSP